jgi:hypothetical protein
MDNRLDYFKESLKTSWLPEQKQESLLNNANYILARLDNYYDKKDSTYIKKIFLERLSSISSFDMQSGNLLSNEDLKKIWINENEESNLWWFIYNSNIPITNNAIEFSTSENIIKQRLKWLVDEWIITIWEKEIPQLKWQIPFWKQIEVLQIMEDFINLKISKWWQDIQEYQDLKKEIEKIKEQYWISLSNNIRELSESISDKDVKQYEKDIIESLKNSNISNEEKAWLIDQIRNWFKDDSVDIKTRIVFIAIIWVVWAALITAIIAGTITLTPILATTIGTELWLIATKLLFTWARSQKIFPFVTWLIPWAWKSQIDRMLSYNWNQTVWFQIWRWANDVLGMFRDRIWWILWETYGKFNK